MALFGISKREAWQKFCETTTAEYIERGFLQRGRIEMPFQSWVIVLDSHTIRTGRTNSTYTRIRTLYHKARDFTFTITKRGVFVGIVYTIGAKQKTGNRRIDADYKTRCGDEQTIYTLFSNDRLSELFLARPFKTYSHIKQFKRSDTDTMELFFQAPGVVKESEQLKNLFDLLGEALLALYEMGIVSDNAPKTML